MLVRHAGHVQRVEWLALPGPRVAAVRNALFLCGAPRTCSFQLASPVIRMLHVSHF